MSIWYSIWLCHIWVEVVLRSVWERHGSWSESAWDGRRSTHSWINNDLLLTITLINYAWRACSFGLFLMSRWSRCLLISRRLVRSIRISSSSSSYLYWLSTSRIGLITWLTSLLRRCSRYLLILLLFIWQARSRLLLLIVFWLILELLFLRSLLLRRTLSTPFFGNICLFPFIQIFQILLNFLFLQEIKSCHLVFLALLALLLLLHLRL